MSRIAAVDLFCGIGGLSSGLAEAGVEVRLGVDHDERAGAAYGRVTGSRFLAADVTTLDAETVGDALAGAPVRVLAAAPPCEAFSTYGRIRRAAPIKRPFAPLDAVVRIARSVRPEVLVIENVPPLAADPRLALAARRLMEAGLHVRAHLVACERHGVAQRRRRLLLIGSRVGPVGLVGPLLASVPTLRDAIGHLPALAAGEVCTRDPLHRAAGLTAINLARIRASRPGGTWRDWPPELRLKCHEAGDGRPTATYGRLRWDEPAPTITRHAHGFGNGRFGHPEQDRALSLREASLLQGFPASLLPFDPAGPFPGLDPVAAWIGAAVPPPVAAAVGRAIAERAG